MGFKSYRVNECYAFRFTSTIYHLPNALSPRILLSNWRILLSPWRGSGIKVNRVAGRSTMLFRIRHRQPQTPPLLLP